MITAVQFFCISKNDYCLPENFHFKNDYSVP